MSEFGNGIVGQSYTTPKGVTFEVLEIEPYHKEKVSKRYTAILSFKPMVLVAVGFRGVNIPNITLDGGVVRLTKVKVNGQTFDRPKTISAALGIERALHPYPLN